ASVLTKNHTRADVHQPGVIKNVIGGEQPSHIECAEVLQVIEDISVGVHHRAVVVDGHAAAGESAAVEIKCAEIVEAATVNRDRLSAGDGERHIVLNAVAGGESAKGVEHALIDEPSAEGAVGVVERSAVGEISNVAAAGLGERGVVQHVGGKRSI